jgi:hypothetical protein
MHSLYYFCGAMSSVCILALHITGKNINIENITMEMQE